MSRTRFDPERLPAAPDLHFETQLWGNGARRVAGIDEAGRGALAGPVYAAAVILPPPAAQAPTLHPQKELLARLAGLNDSKKMSPDQRASWAGRLPRIVLAYSLGCATAQEIDTFGILPATRLAIHRALLALDPAPDHLLVDHIRLPRAPIPQTSLTKGDARSLSIAAASVLAKTARDARMIELDARHPGYGFAAHKGYGTPQHLRAIRRLGPSPVHRMSFAPLKPRLFQEKSR